LGRLRGGGNGLFLLAKEGKKRASPSVQLKGKKDTWAVRVWEEEIRKGTLVGAPIRRGGEPGGRRGGLIH